MGLIYATLGEHEAAVQRFTEATNLDQYLAVAYVVQFLFVAQEVYFFFHRHFQCGVSNFLLTHYDLALRDFEQTLFHLRGNQVM